MSAIDLEKKISDTVWVAHSLFERGKTSGSTANISFRHEDKIYISRSGSCFATLSAEDFAVVAEKNGQPEVISSHKPSKELPLHWQLYLADPSVNAIIHTHSFYSVLWSCLEQENPDDIVPRYTPYLEMKVGKVKLVGYGAPGSKELFQKFGERVGKGGAYLLANHGPVVGGKDMMDAFFKLEELEESIKVAWYLRNEPFAQKIPDLTGGN